MLRACTSFLLLAVGLISVSVPLAGPARAEDLAEAPQISRFSGKAVPRFASLRYSAVHGRRGPGLDHPIIWRYEREGLPVLIVRETTGWRRIRDVSGDEVWVGARMLSEDATALVTEETTLRSRPSEQSRALARLEADVLVRVDTCADGWCKVEVGKTRGQVRQTALWGATPHPDKEAEQRLAALSGNR